MIPTSFQELALAAPIQLALKEQNYLTPSPIQAKSIPTLLQGRDLLGIAQTGTGKTAAFSLPILNALYEKPRKPSPRSVRVLVLTPTRELATQISKSFDTYGRHINFSKTLVFGGVGKNPQVQAMRRGVDVLVACPGRLLDHLNEGDVDLSSVEFFVLDEVDRMLDMGFLRDVKRIIATLPQKRQSLFFSATLSPTIDDLARSILHNPASVSITPEKTTAEKVSQRVCFIDRDHKKDLLAQHLKQEQEKGLTIIFSKTKHGSDKLCRWLNSVGFTAEAIHGNRSQPQRDRTLEKFKSGDLPILVATDVAARGVDVKDVTLVVNFDLPNEPEAYVHRIGRTGRAGAAGSAVSYCSPEEHEFLIDIEKLIQKKLPVDPHHENHDSAFASLHARGIKSPLSTRDNGGNRGGNNNGSRRVSTRQPGRTTTQRAEPRPGAARRRRRQG